MTWLAILLKGFLGPVIVFVFFLLARWGAVAVYRWVPDGKVKRLLLKRIHYGREQ